MVDFAAINARNERSTKRCSLFARYVNFAHNARNLIMSQADLLANDPHDQGENYTDEDLARWATAAECLSELLNARFDELLTDTMAALEEMRDQPPPQPGVRLPRFTCDTCAHRVLTRVPGYRGDVHTCDTVHSHRYGQEVVANLTSCPSYKAAP